MAYGDFIDLHRRTVSDKAFNIAKNPKYNGYQRGLQWFTNFLIRSSQVVLLKVRLCPPRTS